MHATLWRSVVAVEQVALLAAPAGVADHPGGAAGERERPVAGELEAAQRELAHEVAGVQRVGGRVEADVDPDRPVAEAAGEGGAVGRVVDQSTRVEVGQRSIGGHHARSGTDSPAQDSQQPWCHQSTAFCEVLAPVSRWSRAGRLDPAAEHVPAMGHGRSGRHVRSGHPGHGAVRRVRPQRQPAGAAVPPAGAGIAGDPELAGAPVARAAAPAPAGAAPRQRPLLLLLGRATTAADWRPTTRT